MRSTQKNIARLYREVRDLLGVRTNREAGEHIAKAEKHYTRKLNENGVTVVILSPYKNNTWGLYGMKDCRSLFMPLATEAMLDTPFDNVKRFMAAL